MPGNVMAGAAASTKVANNRKLLWEQGTFPSIQWSYAGEGEQTLHGFFHSALPARCYSHRSG